MKKYSLGILAVVLAFGANASVKDSIGQKTVNGKRYVMYKVEAKETLYSLSKLYNTSVDDIKSANDGMAAGLQNGSTILIPRGVSSTEKETQVALSAVQAIHVVGEGETLYSIAKTNNVTVDNVKLWNNLTTNDISLGQELKVSKPGSGNGVIMHSDEKVVVKTDPKLIKTDAGSITGIAPDEGFKTFPTKVSDVEPVSKETYTIDTSLYGEEVTETKSVQKIGQVGVDQTKNLAQMKGVKVGTILMVVNPSNNKATFVRVISGDDTDSIKVTNSVFSALELNAAAETKLKVSYTK